jgi:hypothetical protein
VNPVYNECEGCHRAMHSPVGFLCDQCLGNPTRRRDLKTPRGHDSERAPRLFEHAEYITGHGPLWRHRLELVVRGDPDLPSFAIAERFGMTVTEAGRARAAILRAEARALAKPEHPMAAP